MPPRPRKTPPQPDLAKAVAENIAQAEAEPGKFTVPFTFRGHEFRIDLLTVQFGRAQFGLRVASNESLSILDRVNAAIDVLESAIGQEQLRAAMELAPRLFDDEPTMREFWTAFIEAIHGASPGESSAS